MITGAPEGNNLEPFECDRLLSELENWTDILKAEPEVIHRLESLAQDDDGLGDEAADVQTQASPPDLPEPSP